MMLSNISPDTLRKLILSVGTHRSERPLTPVEVAVALEEAIAAGVSPNQLAEALQLKDATMLSRFRRLLRLPMAVRHLVDWGQGPLAVSFTVASAVARVAEAGDRESILLASIEHRLSSNEVQQVVQVIERARVSADEAITQVLGMRPTVVRHHVFVGAVQSEALRSALRKMTQAKRDEVLIAALRHRASELSAGGGRLGVERFTLVGGDDFGEAMKALTGGFEAAVNDYLAMEVSLND